MCLKHAAEHRVRFETTTLRAQPKKKKNSYCTMLNQRQKLREANYACCSASNLMQSSLLKVNEPMLTLKQACAV